MNHITIIGNLTGDPASRTIGDGTPVCNFMVAVNKKKANPDGSHDADFFWVAAWRGLGENCARYLAKGRKVAVSGSVSVSTYQANDGTTRAQMEVNATEVEFLTPKRETGETNVPAEPAPPANEQPTPVTVSDDELPF